MKDQLIACDFSSAATESFACNRPFYITNNPTNIELKLNLKCHLPSACAQEVGVGALQRHRARVAAQNSRHKGRKFRNLGYDGGHFVTTRQQTRPSNGVPLDVVYVLQGFFKL